MSIKRFKTLNLFLINTLLLFCLSACQADSNTANAVSTQASTPTASVHSIKNTATASHTPKDNSLSGYVIGIDPGHQLKGNNNLELEGPNSTVKKAKVTSGATGNDTGIREQYINLQAAQKLKKALEEKGATVVMTRTTENVDISNKERAELLNKAKVDIAIRIHCDSSDTRSIHGLSILIPDSKNNASIYTESKRLANCLIGSLCKSTGAVNRGVVQRDDQTGFNWSTVPVVTVEMGFLSNSSEEANLVSSSYQDKLVSGYVQGIIDYFNN